jgi:hypothetical protein
MPERLEFVFQALRISLEPRLHSPYLAVPRGPRRFLRAGYVIRRGWWLLLATTIAGVIVMLLVVFAHMKYLSVETLARLCRDRSGPSRIIS